MFKRIINSQAKTITSAAIIIGALSLVSRVLGIFRDRILAAEFGAGDVLDIYYAAFRIPDLIFNLLVLGAISAGLIPVFTSLLSHHRQPQAWRLANNILNILIGSLIAVSVVLFFFTPQLVQIITPGFDDDKLAVVVELTRIMYLSTIFLGISSIFGSILQSFKRFFIYSLAPIFYNVGIIIGALYLVRWWGLTGLAWGVVLGAALHMVVQLVPVFFLGYKYSPRLDLDDGDVRLVGKLMIPRTLTLMVNQFNILIITVAASVLAAGSLAVFNLANNLQALPLGIFGISFAIAALPTLSDFAAKNNIDKFVSAMSVTFRQILFFLVPFSILLYILRAQVVRLILGSGQFSWLDTRLTAACLAIFAFGLFAQGTVPLIIRGFYALKNSVTPFVIGACSLVVNILALLFFSWIFSFDNSVSFFIIAILKMADLWQVADLRILALPLAVSVSAVFNLLLLFIWLRKLIGRIDGKKILDSTLRILFSSLGAGLMAYGALQVVDRYVLTETFVGLLVQGMTAGIIGVAGYWFLGVLLKMEEMDIFVASFKRKLFKKSHVESSGLE